MTYLIIWFWPVIVTGAPALIIYLCRNWFKERLKASISHEYNVKLENTRSENKEQLAHLQADLDRNSSKLAWLSTNTLASLAVRKDKLFERRLSAIDQLWLTVSKAKANTIIPRSLAMMNVDKVFGVTTNNPKEAAKFDNFPGFKDANKIEYLNEADTARPYVSILTWALFQAYKIIITHSALTAMAIKGTLSQDYLQDNGLKEMLKTALPESADTIDKLPAWRCYEFLDTIELKLLNAIQNFDLKGLDLDNESVIQAKDIISKAELAQTEVEKVNRSS